MALLTNSTGQKGGNSSLRKEKGKKRERRRGLSLITSVAIVKVLDTREINQHVLNARSKRVKAVVQQI